MKKQIIQITMIIIAAVSLSVSGQESGKNLYLVIGSGGPGFTSPQEAAMVLEHGILPTFEVLIKLQKEGKIVAGGLPVGARAFTFIVEAGSNDEVDKMLRNLPAWGALNWKVKALESFEGRASQERAILGDLKKSLK